MQTESKRHQYTAEEREQYLRLWRQCGMTQSEFCQQIGLPNEIFDKWICKAEQKSIELLPVAAESLIEIKPVSKFLAMDLLLPSGIRCQINNASVQEVIGFIKEYERCNS